MKGHLTSVKALQLISCVQNDFIGNQNIEYSLPLIGQHANTMTIKKGVLKAKQQAEAGEIELQSILDNLHDLVSLTDLQGNYTFAGPSHKVLGYEIEYLLGKNVMYFVHPEDLPEVQAKFVDFMTSKAERGYAT